MLNNITEFKKEKDLDKAIEIMIDKLSDLQKIIILQLMKLQ